MVEKKSAAGDVLELNDVGAIGSLAEREVIDLMGLTSPEVLNMVRGKSPWDREASSAVLLEQRRPDYLVVFPNWFPRLIYSLPLEPVFQIKL